MPRNLHSSPLLAGAFGALLVLGVAAAPAASATSPGRNGIIVFGADRGSGYQLWTVRPNGTSLRQITAVDGDAVHPDWAPDGFSLVFELDHPAGTPYCSVVVISADGSGARDLTPPTFAGCEAQPSFTPDGTRVVFQQYDETTGVDAIWSMDLAGADRREITRGTGTGVTDPNVSPDGRTLSFVDVTGSDFEQALFSVRLADGSDLRQLTAFSTDVAVKHDWAPDGKHIVFTDNADFPHETDSANVEVIRPDGTGLRPLTHFTGGDRSGFAGSYSPDGHYIAFRLESGGLYGLYRMDTKGRAVHAILPLSTLKPRYIDWSSAG